jgi:spermidine synthase
MTNRTKQWNRWFLETLTPYGAQILSERRDDYGTIRVIELGPYRAMYFDSPSCQGRLHLERPWSPSSEYLRSMLCGASMTPNVERVLLLGLGPGALVHALNHLYPEAFIHTVELRPLVHEAAHDFFNLPVGDQFTHQVLDSTLFIKRPPLEEKFDLILVDMAMSDSVSPLLVQPGFWSHTLSHLSTRGVICANLWRGASHRFEWIFNRLGGCLKTPPSVLRHRQLDNMVVFGSPTVFEDEEILLFRERLLKHSEVLGFDPEHLIAQLPAIQTAEEFFTQGTVIESNWGAENNNIDNLDNS